MNFVAYRPSAISFLYIMYLVESPINKLGRYSKYTWVITTDKVFLSLSQVLLGVCSDFLVDIFVDAVFFLFSIIW